MPERYIAYVGSYSYTGKAKGITILDVDVERGTFTPRCEIDVNNSSYLAVSHDNKFLYSIADEGIVCFRILDNGSLARVNSGDIRGMRGCFIATDPEDRFAFVAGYHDGKATVVNLKKDGGVGKIASGVFHQGLGSVAERNYRPHVSCTRLTPDGRFLCVADLGIDQVKVYKFEQRTGEIQLVDTIRCELESAPRHFIFSEDGRFMYLISELKNVIDVYSYETGETVPTFELLQTISTVGKKHSQLAAASAIRFSPDQTHVFCTNAGDNSVSVFNRNPETGLLTQICCLPISGDYPKDLAVFPDGKHIASINHDTDTITFFHVDYEKGLLVMCGNPIKVNEPNCCEIVPISR